MRNAVKLLELDLGRDNEVKKLVLELPKNLGGDELAFRLMENYSIEITLRDSC